MPSTSSCCSWKRRGIKFWKPRPGCPGEDWAIESSALQPLGQNQFRSSFTAFYPLLGNLSCLFWFSLRRRTETKAPKMQPKRVIGRFFDMRSFCPRLLLQVCLIICANWRFAEFCKQKRRRRRNHKRWSKYLVSSSQFTESGSFLPQGDHSSSSYISPLYLPPTIWRGLPLSSSLPPLRRRMGNGSST